MTTYTTPQHANGPDRNLRPEPGNSARPATAATYRNERVSGEAAVLAGGPTPDWEPGASRGVPKVAIGAIGAALVGGVALAIVLMAPSSKVTRQVDPTAQAAAQTTAATKSVESTEAAVNDMEKNAPAAGNPAATDGALPAPGQAVIPDAPPVAAAPVARLTRHTAPAATPKVASRPVQGAPAVTRDVTPTLVVPAPADVQPPAMQQTPDASTVTPSAPVQPTPDAPAPAPAPAP